MPSDVNRFRNELIESSSTSRFLSLCTEIKTQSLKTHWDYPYDQADVLLELVDSLIDKSDATSAFSVRSLLEEFIKGYNEEAKDDSLTFIHVALSTHCRQYSLTSKFLTVCQKPSIVLPPGEQVGDYFKNCAHIQGICASNWSEAMLHAAVAVTLLPSEDNYQVWCLYELIVNTSVTPLPRDVWSISSSLVDELARLFIVKSRHRWKLILEYVDLHRNEFEKLALMMLVRRALIAYCVRYIENVFSNVSSVPISTILSWLHNEVTFEESVDAGLYQICYCQEGMLFPVILERSKLPSELSTETGELAQKLHGSKHKPVPTNNV